MKPKGYRFAIEWIANNDSPADRFENGELPGYVTVSLVADLYGKTDAQVGQDVLACRAKMKKEV